MFLEVNSDQKMNSLPTLLFFKTFIFIAFLYFDWRKTELRVTLLVQIKCQRQCIGPLTFSKELKNVIIFYIWKFTPALFYFDLYGLLLR